MPSTDDLRHSARLIFEQALASVDAGAAVRRAVGFDGERLKIFDDEFELARGRVNAFSVALGKAAGPMAAALEEVLGGALRGGVLSGPQLAVRLSDRWQVFEGGHPLPNAESLAAARAAFELLRRADAPSSLAIFLVSGGGSAMLELPRNAGIVLEDLREMNRMLVTCGASIAEVNVVRRAVSAVKGGGLCAAAPHAAQVTLIISDTREGQASTVASGPTFPADHSQSAREAATIIERYRLDARLPAPILRALGSAYKRTRANTGPYLPYPSETVTTACALRRHHVLLDNRLAVEAAATAARARGFSVETARDLLDQGVEEGAPLLVSRLLALWERSGGRAVCLVSGGEFACPVRGGGIGGRNGETVLRCALELERRVKELSPARPRPAAVSRPTSRAPRFVALSAGTDGIDGNSPAAGAICDETTARRARLRGLDPRHYLDTSDAYTFFDALGDAITTGPTGTNVRDLRILLAM